MYLLSYKKLFNTISDNKITIYDLKSHIKIANLLEHKDTIKSLCLLKNDSEILSTILYKIQKKDCDINC